MYFEKDYILRLIDMMADFFRGLMEKADRADREKALDAFCRERCGMPLDAARAMEYRTLEELLNEHARFYLSEALYMDARLLPEGEKKDISLLLALRLLSRLSQDDALAAARADRLRELTQLTKDSLAAEDYAACAEFFLYGGRFADMEDMIFLAAETAEYPERYIRAGREMLLNILTLPDEALILGGLPREEARQSLADLSAMAEDDR